jgi:predicted RNA binding protein YcfA (HicA-like mRNA interferase family)
VSVLPLVSGRDVVKALLKLATNTILNEVVISSCGSRHIHIGVSFVPNHKEVAKGTLRSIIRETGLTVGEFKDLL